MSTSPVTASSDERAGQVHRKVALRLLPILFLGYVIAYLDRANVGFAKLRFIGDLGFDEAVYGLGGGLFYLGYAPEFEARKPQIRDTIISILNTKRADDLLKKEGKSFLKEEIKASINSFLVDGRVEDIYYISFQIN